MDSHRCNNRRSDIAIFLLIIWLSSPAAVAGDEEKVKLSLYYEVLCPGCANFILNYLYKIFDNGLISIVDLKLSPYGNANVNSDGTIACQHGEWECMLNTIQACSIHVWPVVTEHFPFVFCMQKLYYDGKYTEWETCFKILGLDPGPVFDCYNSGIGYELELQYADEITALEPPKQYVPWIVVDGQPLYSDYTDFESFICKAYKGSNVPGACLGLTRPITAGYNRSGSHVNEL